MQSSQWCRSKACAGNPAESYATCIPNDCAAQQLCAQQPDGKRALVGGTKTLHVASWGLVIQLHGGGHLELPLLAPYVRSYCCSLPIACWPYHPADVVKIKQQAADGKVKERYKGSSGAELSYNIKLGKDPLPADLSNGCLLLVAGEQLMSCFKSSMEAAAPSELPPQMQRLPGPGVYEVQPVVSRSRQGPSASTPSSTNLEATMQAALAMVGRKQAELLLSSPFAEDDSVGAERLGLQTVITEVSNCSATGHTLCRLWLRIVVCLGCVGASPKPLLQGRSCLQKA